jgi:hypothetical protein
VDCEEHDIDRLLMRAYVPQFGDWAQLKKDESMTGVVDFTRQGGLTLRLSGDMAKDHLSPADLTLLHRWEQEE